MDAVFPKLYWDKERILHHHIKTLEKEDSAWIFSQIYLPGVELDTNLKAMTYFIVCMVTGG